MVDLPELRSVPKRICEGNAFKVKGLIVDADEGGPCSLSMTSLPTWNRRDDNVHQIRVTAGGSDWYFPYRHGVGFCRVPAGQPNGTLAVTGGMNGCTLEVYRDGGELVFYHDNNGTHLRRDGVGPAGTRLAEVSYRDYAGPSDVGIRQSASLTTEARTPVYFEHTLICVKQADRWQVYVTGVHTFPIVGKYAKFVPHITSLVTSFAEA